MEDLISIPPHPRCMVPGCTREPTLGIQNKDSWEFLCDKHRPDKKREKQFHANYRQRIKAKYGVDIGRSCLV